RQPGGTRPERAGLHGRALRRPAGHQSRSQPDRHRLSGHHAVTVDYRQKGTAGVRRAVLEGRPRHRAAAAGGVGPRAVADAEAVLTRRRARRRACARLRAVVPAARTVYGRMDHGSTVPTTWYGASARSIAVPPDPSIWYNEWQYRGGGRHAGICTRAQRRLRRVSGPAGAGGVSAPRNRAAAPALVAPLGRA